MKIMNKKKSQKKKKEVTEICPIKTYQKSLVFKILTTADKDSKRQR